MRTVSVHPGQWSQGCLPVTQRYPLINGVAGAGKGERAEIRGCRGGGVARW